MKRVTSVNSPRSVSAMSKFSTKTAPIRGSKPYRKFHYILKEYGKFGNGTPKWTISSRIDKAPPINNTPGPGDYEIPDKIFRNSKLPHVISSRSASEPVSITANLDYNIKTNILPDNPITIGKLTGQSYISNIYSPDRTYIPAPFGSDSTIKIHERYEIKDDNEVPGPGHYNPIHKKRHVPTYSMAIRDFSKKNKKRNEEEQQPGPGSYELIKPLPPVGNWTEKFREKPKRKRNQPVNRLCPWEKPKLVLNV
jgi:hypothetical protein